MARPNLSCETKSSDANGDRGIELFIFPLRLNTSRISNLTRLIHTPLRVMTIHNITHANGGCGKREARKSWPVMIPKKAATVT